MVKKGFPGSELDFLAVDEKKLLFFRFFYQHFASLNRCENIEGLSKA
jgi:hypothetical protein